MGGARAGWLPVEPLTQAWVGVVNITCLTRFSPCSNNKLPIHVETPKKNKTTVIHIMVKFTGPFLHMFRYLYHRSDPWRPLWAGSGRVQIPSWKLVCPWIDVDAEGGREVSMLLQYIPPYLHGCPRHILLLMLSPDGGCGPVSI